MSKHSLEGNQAFILFFQQLWKKDKDMNSATGVMLPETVVYEHNFPIGYYYYSNGIHKKAGKDLESISLYNDFEKFEDKSHGIVAYYLSQYEEPDTGEIFNRVEFLEKEALKEFFLKRKVRDRGILQRFITPKGSKNCMIMAVWSPHVTLLERRINVSKLDQTQPKLSPFERAVTYEGPSHYSQEVYCSPSLKEQVEKVCKNIVTHFENTDHRKITRMVLYFKSDNNGDLWLSYCSSIRISGDDKKGNPVDLSPCFCSATEESAGIFDEFDTLNTTIKKSGTSDLNAPSGNLLDKWNRDPNSSASSPISNLGVNENIFAEEETRSSTSEQEKWMEGLKRDPLADELNDTLDDTLYQMFSHFLEDASGDEYHFELPALVRDTLGRQAATVERILSKFDIHRLPQSASGEENEKGGPLTGEYSMSRRSAGGAGPMQHRFMLLLKNLMKLYFKVYGYPEIVSKADSTHENGIVSEIDSEQEDNVDDQITVQVDNSTKEIGQDASGTASQDVDNPIK